MKVKIYDPPVLRIAGDQGILLEFGDGIDRSVHLRVRAATMLIEKAQLKGVIEVIPTYRSLMIVYDSLAIPYSWLAEALMDVCGTLAQAAVPPPERKEIPVCYGQDFGADLAFVAASHRLEPEEVIRLHAQPEYLVYMIGFTPGFPFLGGLPEKLHTPRLKTPRTKVPAGSVGIANNQTGIYSIESPGGWQLIGRVPLKIFDPARQTPFLIKAGDLIKFKPISAKEYVTLEQRA